LGHCCDYLAFFSAAETAKGLSLTNALSNESGNGPFCASHAKKEPKSPLSSRIKGAKTKCYLPNAASQIEEAAMPRRIISKLLLSAALILPTMSFGAEAPGQHIMVTPDQMPEPYATPAQAARFDAYPRPSAEDLETQGVELLELPDGFEWNLFAEGLKDARWLAVAPNGDVFLAQSRFRQTGAGDRADTGHITILRDADGDGTAELIETFDDDYERPHGLAFNDGALYVGERRGIYRIPYADGDTSAQSREMITERNPFVGGSREGHWTRNLAVSPSGELFVSVGSADNIAVEPEPRATIQRVGADGELTTFATGLRNAVGIEFYPGTNDIYTVVNERDGYGDGLVPDYFTRVQEDGFYGWPYSYIGSHPDPQLGDERPDLVAAAIEPDVLFASHSAPLGFAFYDAEQFPERYRGGAFVALHGSWNSSVPTGYKLVYVPFENQRPAGGYENFALGFRFGGVEQADIIGRPVGVVVANDGSLLVADDIGEAIWRISYTGG
jgi:glucose/arabinose dehydrogenase